MGWLFWFLAAWFVFAAAGIVANIGKPRTKKEAILGVLEAAAVIAVMAIWWPR